MLRGACHMEYADGREEVIEEGEVYYMPAAHTGWMEPNSAMLVFSPEAEARVVQEHIAKSMGGWRREVTMNGRNALPVLPFALPSAACQPPAQEAGPLSEADIAVVRALVKRHSDAMLAQDWATVAAGYTEDALPAETEVFER